MTSCLKPTDRQPHGTERIIPANKATPLETPENALSLVPIQVSYSAQTTAPPTVENPTAKTQHIVPSDQPTHSCKKSGAGSTRAYPVALPGGTGDLRHACGLHGHPGLSVPCWLHGSPRCCCAGRRGKRWRGWRVRVAGEGECGSSAPRPPHHYFKGGWEGPTAHATAKAPSTHRPTGACPQEVPWGVCLQLPSRPIG